MHCCEIICKKYLHGNYIGQIILGHKYRYIISLPRDYLLFKYLMSKKVVTYIFCKWLMSSNQIKYLSQLDYSRVKSTR